jgi:hypothetical protein
MMKILNPINFFSVLKRYVREFRAYLFYVNTIKRLKKSGEFEKRNLRVDFLNRVYFIHNLNPEILMYGEAEEGGIERFEKQFVAESLRAHNDLFIGNELIDIVKTSTTRIKNQDYYAYLVKIGFRFRTMTFWNTIYLIAYLGGVVWLTIFLAGKYPGIRDWVKTITNP